MVGFDFDQINEKLRPHNVKVYFTKESYADLKSYKKSLKETIIAFIVSRGIRGPLIKPKGVGTPLRNELKGFTKIKLKHLGLRIVYRPVLQNETIRMEIIAIGPRDKEKVYKLAAKRLVSFYHQMDHSS